MARGKFSLGLRTCPGQVIAEIQKRGIVKVVLEIGFTSIKAVTFVGTKGAHDKNCVNVVQPRNGHLSKTLGPVKDLRSELPQVILGKNAIHKTSQGKNGSKREIKGDKRTTHKPPERSRRAIRMVHEICDTSNLQAE